MDITEYVRRIKDLNHTEQMLRRERKKLVREFLMGVDLIPGDTVFLRTTYRDTIETDKYLVHGVDISFCGTQLVLDIESPDGAFYTYQLPIEKMGERLKPLTRQGLPFTEQNDNTNPT